MTALILHHYAALLGLAPIMGWLERVLGLGHGKPKPMSAEGALAAAHAAEPASVAHLGCATDGLQAGSAIRVIPDDFARVPVSGTLVGADDQDIMHRRHDPRTGDRHVHFRRAGFEMKAA